MLALYSTSQQEEYNLNIPGQGSISHTLSSVAFPAQGTPPKASRTFTNRARTCSPSPQVWEQVVHSPQSSHSQST